MRTERLEHTSSRREKTKSSLISAPALPVNVHCLPGTSSRSSCKSCCSRSHTRPCRIQGPVVQAAGEPLDWWQLAKPATPCQRPVLRLGKPVRKQGKLIRKWKCVLRRTKPWREGLELTSQEPRVQRAMCPAKRTSTLEWCSKHNFRASPRRSGDESEGSKLLRSSRIAAEAAHLTDGMSQFRPKDLSKAKKRRRFHHIWATLLRGLNCGRCTAFRCSVLGLTGSCCRPRRWPRVAWESWCLLPDVHSSHFEPNSFCRSTCYCQRSDVCRSTVIPSPLASRASWTS